MQVSVEFNTIPNTIKYIPFSFELHVHSSSDTAISLRNIYSRLQLFWYDYFFTTFFCNYCETFFLIQIFFRRCSHGFIAGPEHCLDINECDDQPCHSSAECVNLHGSYRCVCPQGTAGDPVGSGCVTPHQCTVNADCADSQTCVQHNCTDPCSLVDCGLNTICSVLDHTAACQCQPGYIGDSSGCFRVECLSNNDCPIDKYCNQDINKCSSKWWI